MASARSAAHFPRRRGPCAFVEARLWPAGPVCPHRGGVARIGDKSTRIGLHKRYRCRKPFTGKVGTIFESSHVPLNAWLQAIQLVAGSEKGIGSNQLHRTLGVTLKTAWFMSHRIREAMRSGGLAPFDGDGGTVEVSETLVGDDLIVKPHGEKRRRGFARRRKVLSLVDRNTGHAKSMVVDDPVARPVLLAGAARWPPRPCPRAKTDAPRPCSSPTPVGQRNGPSEQMSVWSPAGAAGLATALRYGAGVVRSAPSRRSLPKWCQGARSRRIDRSIRAAKARAQVAWATDLRSEHEAPGP